MSLSTFLFGGDTGGYDKAAAKAQELSDNAQRGLNSQAGQGHNIISQNDWRARLDASNALRQEANAYETNAAVQAALSAYGGSPLSGNARNAVQDRAQQNARSLWQQGLDNSNAMLGTDTSNRLGIQQALISGTSAINANNLSSQMSAMGAKADAKAADTGLLGKAGKALDIVGVFS
jgi:hypothetical protein